MRPNCAPRWNLYKREPQQCFSVNSLYKMPFSSLPDVQQPAYIGVTKVAHGLDSVVDLEKSASAAVLCLAKCTKSKLLWRLRNPKSSPTAMIFGRYCEAYWPVVPHTVCTAGSKPPLNEPSVCSSSFNGCFLSRLDSMCPILWTTFYVMWGKERPSQRLLLQ